MGSCSMVWEHDDEGKRGWPVRRSMNQPRLGLRLFLDNVDLEHLRTEQTDTYTTSHGHCSDSRRNRCTDIFSSDPFSMRRRPDFAHWVIYSDSRTCSSSSSPKMEVNLPSQIGRAGHCSDVPIPPFRDFLRTGKVRGTRSLDSPLSRTLS
jgi:hypothetical protein